MSPEHRREQMYFHAPDHEEIKRTIGQERWDFISRDLFVEYWSNPSMEFLRLWFSSLIYEMYNYPSEARKAGYSDLETLYSIAMMQEMATRSGLLLGQEVIGIHNGTKPERVNPANKYATWEEILGLTKKWSDEGQTIGIVHGALDPVHVEQGNAINRIYPYCDYVIVGFDPNWYIKARKGPDRPRFPQLAWRMWNIASLPTVSKVFVLPFKKPTIPNDDDFYRLYQDLHVTVLGTDFENPLLERYKSRMESLGGVVITGSGDKYDYKKVHSSTELMSIWNRGNAKEPDPEIQQAIRTANEVNTKALSAGYLRDHPDGTN